jgi:osmotically-inducible protein OsmY
MKGTVLSLAAVLVTGTVGIAQANDTDGKVEDRVEARINHDVRLKDHSSIRVDVSDGVATLKGKVANEADKLRAARLARVAGVKRVDNQLEIDADKAKDRIEESADKAKDRIDDQAKAAKHRVDERAERAKDRIEDGKPVPAPAPGARVVPDHNGNGVDDRVENRVDDNGNPITDSWITTKVKAQYVGVDAMKGSDVTVTTTNDGVVTLTGTVPNELARARAVEIARTTKGVRRVVDSMKTVIK